jgi:outer membrane protein assembly factor BamE (lipoprotein component of BamABCDE complex)
MKKYLVLTFSLLITIILEGCVTTDPPASIVNNARQDSAANRLTLGKIQQTLVKGMGQAEVVTSLGSPNMVTRDKEGTETWVYDKFLTETTTLSADQRAGIGGGVGAASGNVLGILGASVAQGSSASNQIRTQKTITVILKFKNQELIDFVYNSSSF